jgi:hypothetical protein
MTPYHRDDGTLIDPQDYPIPKLCLRCKNLGEFYEEIECTLRRIDREKDEKFICYGFRDCGWKMNAFKYLIRRFRYRIRYLFFPRWIKE